MAEEESRGPRDTKSDMMRYGAHEIIWDQQGYGKCRVCGRAVSQIEVADDRNKDCGNPLQRGKVG